VGKIEGLSHGANRDDARYPVIVKRKSEEELRRDVGLCADCQFMRKIVTDRGSTFYQCQLSATNPDFPKYPRLPVVRCTGYQPLAKSQQ